MSKIEWVKGFDVYVDNKILAKIDISKHDEGMFSASCRYSEDERLLSTKNEDRALAVQFKKIIGESEGEVVQEITEWAKEKFGEKVKLVERASM